MTLKKIVELSPLITAFLIFNGLLKLSIYYGYWGIHIIDYLNFSEILLSFFNDLNIIILCCLIFVCHQVVFAIVFALLEKNQRKKISSPSAPHQAIPTANEVKATEPVLESISDAVGHTFTHQKGWLLLGSFFVVAIFSILFIFFNKMWLLYFAIFAITQFLFLCIVLYMKGSEKNTMPILPILMFVLFTVSLSWYEIRYTKENSAKSLTTIYLENDVITTSPKIYFLGKSQSFVYLFNTELQQTQIIPVDKISSIKTQKI